MNLYVGSQTQATQPLCTGRSWNILVPDLQNEPLISNERRQCEQNQVEHNIGIFLARKTIGSTMIKTSATAVSGVNQGRMPVN
jgi:hypothetical protein